MVMQGTAGCSTEFGELDAKIRSESERAARRRGRTQQSDLDDTYQGTWLRVLSRRASGVEVDDTEIRRAADRAASHYRTEQKRKNLSLDTLAEKSGTTDLNIAQRHDGSLNPELEAKIESATVTTIEKIPEAKRITFAAWDTYQSAIPVTDPLNPTLLENCTMFRVKEDLI